MEGSGGARNFQLRGGGWMEGLQPGQRAELEPIRGYGGGAEPQ